MQLFKCQHCAQLLHFENRQCVSCGHRLGYIAEQAMLAAIEPVDGLWQPVGQPLRFRFCQNADFDACNWLVESDDAEAFCAACRYNRTIPDLDVGDNLANWQKTERAKHHLFYSLLRLRLPLVTRQRDPHRGLAFDFLTEPPTASSETPTVLTGHEDGVITINLIEADDAMREQRRVRMGEPYRTLLGHFRHEIGHYFWDRLVADSDRLAAFRERFGDETVDYGTALQTYYANGPAPDWEARYVSAYATAHPWEDFAETWAHYLHIVDTLEMAGAYGLRLQPPMDGVVAEIATDRFDPYIEGTIEQLMEIWLPITLAVNSLNRCIGQPDFYPFVLSPAVVAKLGYVHALVRNPPVFERVVQEAAA